MNQYEMIPRRTLILQSKNAKRIREGYLGGAVVFVLLELCIVINVTLCDCTKGGTKPGAAGAAVCFAVLLLLGAAAFAIWLTKQLRCMTHDFDRYLLCPLRLTDMKVRDDGSGFRLRSYHDTGATFSMTPHVMLPDGRELTPPSDMVYTAKETEQLLWSETNQPELYALYDPQDGRLLILLPQEE